MKLSSFHSPADTFALSLSLSLSLVIYDFFFRISVGIFSALCGVLGILFFLWLHFKARQLSLRWPEIRFNVFRKPSSVLPSHCSTPCVFQTGVYPLIKVVLASPGEIEKEAPFVQKRPLSFCCLVRRRRNSAVWKKGLIEFRMSSSKFYFRVMNAIKIWILSTIWLLSEN